MIKLRFYKVTKIEIIVELRYREDKIEALQYGSYPYLFATRALKMCAAVRASTCLKTLPSMTYQLKWLSDIAQYTSVHMNLMVSCLIN